MKGYVAIIVAATLVVCQCVMNEESQPAQKCCFEDFVSMSLTEMNTVNFGEMSILETQIDFIQKREVLLNKTFNPKSGTWREQNKIFIDYAESTLSFVPADSPDRCFNMSYSATLPQCIPDDAEYLGSHYLITAGKLPYNWWRFRAPNSSTVVTIAVTNDCVPLVEGSIPSVDPSFTSQVYMITNFQPVLTNVSAFKLPDFCYK